MYKFELNVKTRLQNIYWFVFIYFLVWCPVILNLICLYLTCVSIKGQGQHQQTHQWHTEFLSREKQSEQCGSFAMCLKSGLFSECAKWDQHSAQVWFKRWFDHQPKRWDSSNRKVKGRSDGELGGGGTLRDIEEEEDGGCEEEEEDEVEIKWKMALFTKNALCQSWKRTDKGKRKKERKERMK